VDHELGCRETELAESHVSVCPGCRKLAEECRETRDLVRDKRVIEPIPEGLWPRTLAALDKAVRVRARTRRIAFAAAGFAAVMALAAVSYEPLHRYISPGIVISQDGIVRDTVAPVVVKQTSHTGEAFALVRMHLNADVPPVNLSLVGGKLSQVAVYENPTIGVLTYQMRKGGELRYFISRTRFRLQEAAENWTIGETEVQAVCAPTHFVASWEDRGISYAVLGDRVPPDPKAVIGEFIDSLLR
jgi:hypothetical protein